MRRWRRQCGRGWRAVYNRDKGKPIVNSADAGDRLSYVDLAAANDAIVIALCSKGAVPGSLDEIMHEIADKYQEEIDQRFTNVISILEPTLVIALSVIVGMILLSVMLPLMGIMSSL